MHERKALLQQSPWSNSFGSTIYQWGLMALSKCPPGRLDFRWSKGKKLDTPHPPSSCNSKTKSHKGEPKWLSKYLITPNFCAKFQPNRLTTNFGPWNTFSDNATQVKLRVGNFSKNIRNSNIAKYTVKLRFPGDKTAPLAVSFQYSLQSVPPGWTFL